MDGPRTAVVVGNRHDSMNTNTTRYTASVAARLQQRTDDKVKAHPHFFLHGMLRQNVSRGAWRVWQSKACLLGSICPLGKNPKQNTTKKTDTVAPEHACMPSDATRGESVRFVQQFQVYHERVATGCPSQTQLCGRSSSSTHQNKTFSTP